MSRRQYRRNGTPIGKHKVYALVFKRGEWTQSYEIVPQGIETYEDLESLVMLEMIEGKFGAPERLVITKPGADLGGSIMRNLNLMGCNLSWSDLSDCQMSNCLLYESDLSGSNLTYANLYRCNLSKANLKDANLSFCKLYGADLDSSILTRAELSGAELTKANMENAILNNVSYDQRTIWPDDFKPPPSRDGYRPGRRR